jgi:hypothetical protein
LTVRRATDFGEFMQRPLKDVPTDTARLASREVPDYTAAAALPLIVCGQQ